MRATVPVLDPLRLGLRFLTVLPVAEPASGTRPARALTWYPVIGLVVGAPLWVALSLPLPALPRAALAAVFWVVITGGLHEDAWADTIDAAFAPLSSDERLRILRDPHVGAHGLTGAVLLQLARFAALALVPAHAVLVAPVIGRWAMATSLSLARPARNDGLGASFAASAPLRPALTALVILVVLGWLFRPAPVGAAVAAGGLSAWLLGRFLAGRFGGLSGDGHGSVGVAAELVALWCFIPPGATA